MATVTVKLPVDLVQEVERASEEMGVPKSKIYRAAVERLLSEKKRVLPCPCTYVGPLVVVSFKVDKDVLDALNRLAKRGKTSRSQLLRRAICSVVCTERPREEGKRKEKRGEEKEEETYRGFKIKRGTITIPEKRGEA